MDIGTLLQTILPNGKLEGYLQYSTFIVSVGTAGLEVWGLGSAGLILPDGLCGDIWPAFPVVGLCTV